MKLISMTEFVLERSLKDISEYTVIDAFKDGAKVMNEIFSYAKFINQPLTLGMFVPCDEDGNVLEEPEYHEPHSENEIGDYQELRDKFEEAKSKVLLDGFELLHEIYRFPKEKVYKLVLDSETIIHIVEKNTIEDLSFSNIYRLTPNAIKQLGL